MNAFCLGRTEDFQIFHDQFEKDREVFDEYDGSDDIVKTHISTMTFTSRLVNVSNSDALYSYIMSLVPDDALRDRLGLITIPRIEQSRFSKYAVDIVPFSGMDDKIRVRCFCTTGSLLITGCTAHLQCLSALDEVMRLLKGPLFGDLSCEVPRCRLINVNFALKYTINIENVARLCENEAAISLVETPERSAVTIIHLADGTKVMAYPTGKFSAHGNSYASLDTARRVCVPIFKLSRGLPT
jgi:hypothetical protein